MSQRDRMQKGERERKRHEENRWSLKTEMRKKNGCRPRTTTRHEIRDSFVDLGTAIDETTPMMGGMMINRCMVPYSPKKKHGKSVVQSPPLRASLFSAGNGDTMPSMSALKSQVISTSSDASHHFLTSM